MVIAYYNPEQEKRMEEASDPSIKRIYAASNKSMGFMRIRCADCHYRQTHNNYGDVCCPFDELCEVDDWFCANFKPVDGGEDESIG